MAESNPISCAKRGALTGAYAYGKARRRTLGRPATRHILTGVETLMVKPEWGTKRTCPKCSTRFYDLGKEDPVHCIECGTDFVPEPVLKSKQPLAVRGRAGGQGAREGRRRSRAPTISRSTRTRSPAPTRKSISRPATTISASRPAARTTKAESRSPAADDFPLFQRGKVRLRGAAEGRGAVAQLGERCNGIAKVRGSIPLGSTIPFRPGSSRLADVRQTAS